MSVIEDLTDARNLIAELPRLGKGEYVDGDGCFCALGAILEATGNSAYSGMADAVRDERLSDAIAALAHAIDPDAPDHGWDNQVVIIQFNDANGTKKADVLDAFDRAIIGVAA